MAVKIRLRRTGGKGQPSYRIVIADSRSPRDGRFIENVGNYQPRLDPPVFDVDDERVRYWLSKGAQPSDAVARLLVKKGLLAERRLRMNTGGKKTEQPEATAAAPAAGA